MNKIIGTSEKEILLDATQALARLAGVRIEQLPVWASYGRIYQDNQAVSKITDAHISISSVGTTRAFDVEIKGELRKDQVLPIIERFGRDKENYLLVARYIPQPIKEYFVKVGVNYLESAGNCSIKAPGLLLYISDQKVTPVRAAIPGKLWKRTGLKFLLAIIEQPKLLNAPYREVAEAADIAVGNIGQLKEELHKEEYVKIIDGEMILINHDVLISRWSGIYGATMRPRLKGGFYRFLRSADQEAWEQLPGKGMYWGGEAGGALLTRHLKPKTFTIYVDYENIDIIKKHRIVPDMEGEIIVLEKFWGILPPSIAFNDIPAPANVAPALVVYTDLANSFDSRNHEIANRIKKKYLLHE